MSLLLYLDAGTINRIADGECRHGSVDDLHRVMRATGSVLVLSLAHIWDFCSGSTDDTKARVARAIDAFPQRALACDGPESIEREALNALADGNTFQPDTFAASRWAPRLRPIQDFAGEVFGDDGLMADVQRLVQAARGFSTAARVQAANRRERRAAGRHDPRRSRLVREVQQRQLASILTADSPEQIHDVFLRSVAQAPPELRAEAEAHLVPLLEARAMDLLKGRQDWQDIGLTPQRAAQIALRQPGVVAVGFAGGHIGGGMERWYEVAAVVAPGLALKARLAEGNESNVGRDPTPSDQADRLHLQYAPYMDVTLVDANNLAAIRPLLRMIRSRRRGVVMSDPGRDLTPLVEKVKELTSTA